MLLAHGLPAAGLIVIAAARSAVSPVDQQPGQHFQPTITWTIVGSEGAASMPERWDSKENEIQTGETDPGARNLHVGTNELIQQNSGAENRAEPFCPKNSASTHGA